MSGGDAPDVVPGTDIPAIVVPLELAPGSAGTVLVVGPGVDRQHLTRVWPALDGVLGFAFAAPEGAGSLENRIRAGLLPVVAPSDAGFVDAGPRAVDDLTWVRSIRLPLRGLTRGSVNAFLVSTNDGYVLVDAGLNSEAPRLARALEIAGIRRGEVRAIICTHLHADHVGGASALRRDGWLGTTGEVVVSRDTDRLGRAMFLDATPRFTEHLVANGVREEDLPQWLADLRMMAGYADWPREVRLVDDGDRLRVGDVEFGILATAGHCPDHIAIVARRDNGEGVVFLGDLTLGDELPQCGVRDWESEDAIADLMRGWDAIVAERIALGLPAHGRAIDDIPAFRDELDRIHDVAVRRFVDRFGGKTLTGADIASALVSDDDAWGPRQFAFYGGVAMLHHLAQKGHAHMTGTRPQRFEVQA